MVKKLGENDKPIEPKPKAVRRRYVRKLNPKLPKLDVQDFLPKLKGKTATDLKREVMKIRETLESEYQELKKKVTERKEKALQELSSKSTETVKKEQIKNEKTDEVKLEKADEIKTATVQALLEYIDTQKTPTKILETVDTYQNATQKSRGNFNKKLKTFSKDPIVLGNYVRDFRALPSEQRERIMESVEPFRKLPVRKMTAAEKAEAGSHKITEFKGFSKQASIKQSEVEMPSLTPVRQADSDSDDEGKAAGFKKLKKHAKEHHNIALIGKEDQMRMGEMSISVARDIRQLNELKRNHRGVVIRRSDLIDAERPINYELSIM